MSFVRMSVMQIGPMGMIMNGFFMRMWMNMGSGRAAGMMVVMQIVMTVTVGMA